ncbi:uncharacterized protein LOC142318227 [Lycorma delicatula]|uniref:uncharacterized protein LOC142318227 n=1 Tax=Lycorma delicatula TaxID=130591 RepID=UPI003F5106DF
MRVLLFTVLGLTLLALVFSHHGNDEEHLLNSLLDAYVQRDDDRAEESINNFVDVLLRKCFEKLRGILQGHEPYPIPDIGPTEVKDQNVQVNITLTNIKEDQGSQFVVNSLDNSLFRLTEAFNVTFPKLHLEGDYKINGKVLGKAVTGNGHFNVWATNIVSWGKAYAHLVHGYVQLKKLTLDYTVETITANATGLKVQGLTETQVNDFLSHSLKQYCIDNERVVADTISGEIVGELNLLLQGMSISDIITWLKHFISPSEKLF